MVKLTADQARHRGGAQAATDESYARKIPSCGTLAFEENHSKDQILEHYLNIAYFGDGAYGIEAAAQHYFSVTPAKLNLRPVGHAGRTGAEPHRLQPDQLPRRRSPVATSCSTGWPS